MKRIFYNITDDGNKILLYIDKEIEPEVSIHHGYAKSSEVDSMIQEQAGIHPSRFKIDAIHNGYFNDACYVVIEPNDPEVFVMIKLAFDELDIDDFIHYA